MRREITEATPRLGDHVLVYQTTAGDPRLLPALRANRSARFVLYGLGRDESLGNVELRRSTRRASFATSPRRAR